MLVVVRVAWSLSRHRSLFLRLNVTLASAKSAFILSEAANGRFFGLIDVVFAVSSYLEAFYDYSGVTCNRYLRHFNALKSSFVYKFAWLSINLHALKDREITRIHYQNMYSCPCQVIAKQTYIQQRSPVICSILDLQSAICQL